MALIACRECNNQVSDTATSCPHCGAPIQAAADSRSVGTRLTTTQLTSKRLKLHSLLAVTAFIAGLVMAWAGGPTEPGGEPNTTLPAVGGLLILGGGIWYFVTKFRVWWHHK